MITFKAAGEYKFTITEQAPTDAVDGKKDGITYDTTPKTVTVTVEENGGALSVTSIVYSGDNADALTVTNTYEAEPVEEQLEVTKELTGGTWPDDGFEFTLETEHTEEDGVTMPTTLKQKATESDPTAVFDAIKFSKAGTFTFTITETVPTDAVEGKKDGITYDGTPKTVTVKVEDNKAGALVVTEVKYDGEDSLTVTNTYDAEPVEEALEVTKALTNGDGKWPSEGFEFTLAEIKAGQDGVTMPETATATATEDEKKATFGNIKFEKAGTYYFTIVETVPADAENNVLDGITYDCSEHIIVVTIKDNEMGALEVDEVKYDGSDELTVTNSYGAEDTTTQLEVTKVVDNSAIRWPAEGFTFELAADPTNPAGATLPETTTVIATEAVKTAKFGMITFTEDRTYKFTITEKAPEGAEPGTDGKYVKDGITYDTTAKEVTVKIKDNKGKLEVESVKYDGSTELTVTNTYTAKGYAEIPVTKYAKGFVLDSNHTYTFTIAAKEGTEPAAKMNKEDGTAYSEDELKAITGDVNSHTDTVNFPTFWFTEEDVGKTYVYTVKEVIPDQSEDETAAYYLFDRSEYEVSLTVCQSGKDADGDGKDDLTVTRTIRKIKASDGTTADEYAERIEFENEHLTGSLRIEKKVYSDIESDHSEVFLFRLRMWDEFGQPLDGPQIAYYFMNADGNAEPYDGRLGENDDPSVYEFYLRDGDYIVLNNIPLGTVFMVEECEDDRFETLYRVGIPATAAIPGALLNILDAYEEGYIAEGSILNPYRVEMVSFANIRKTGDLIIEKTVNSSVGADNTEREYVFHIELSEAVTQEFAADRTDSEGNKAEETVEFRNGNATVTLKANESLYIYDLPAGAEYTVFEDVPENFGAPVYDGDDALKAATGTIPEMNTAEDAAEAEAVTASIENTRETGNLELSKKVISTNAADHDAVYTFKVTLDDKTVNGTFAVTDAEDNAILNEDGTAVTVKFEDGESVDIAVKGDTEIIIKGLPAGIGYTVSEEEPDGFTVICGGETGMIGAKKTGHARITNIKNEGGLALSKRVISAIEADHEAEYTFLITLTNAALTGTYGDAVFEEKTGEDGTKTYSATVTIKEDQVKVITGLPEGTKYTVAEINEDGTAAADGALGKVFTVSADVTGEIEAKKTQKAEILNTRKTTQLSLTKTVENPIGTDSETVYQFTLVLKNGKEILNGTYGGYSFENGEIKLGIKAGETVTITGIPVGTTYSLKEENIDLSAFTVTMDGDEKTEIKDGKIEDDGTTAVEIVNTRLLTEATVTKVWDDLDDVNGMRPESIRMLLQADGVTVADVILNAENEWTATVTGLPKAANGKEIVYSWIESEIPQGYRAEQTTDDEDDTKTVVTNTLKRGKLSIDKKVSGITTDKSFEFIIQNSDETLYLNADGTLSADEYRFSITDGQTVTIENIPEGFYKVTELGIEKDGAAQIKYYTLMATQEGSGAVTETEEGEVTLKNDYTALLGKLRIAKAFCGVPNRGTQWDEEALKALTFSVTGVDENGDIIYDEEFTFEDLIPAGETPDGNLIFLKTIEDLLPGDYTVTESKADKIVTGYTLHTASSIQTAEATVADGATVTAVLKNNYKKDTGKLYVTKAFIGTEKTDEKILDSLEIRVTGSELLNGETYDRIFHYADFVNGTLTIENLIPGNYTVTEINAETLIDAYTFDSEVSVTAGSVTLQKDEEGTVTLKNVYGENPGSLSIVKTFIGNPEDADLSELTFHITGPDGYEKTVTYAEFTSGSYTLTDLTPGTYTVTETNAGTLIADYHLVTETSITAGEADVTEEKGGMIDLKNVYEVDKGSLKISKTFSGTPEGADLSGLTFHITGPDGYSEYIAYAAFTDGSYTLTDLPVGEYTVTETNAEGLIVNYTLKADSTTTAECEIVLDKETEAELSNNYEEDLGSLKIIKEFRGISQYEDVSGLKIRIIGPYDFDRIITYKDFKDGVYELKDIPIGTYLIYELNAGTISASSVLKDTSVTALRAKIVKSKITEATLINEYDEKQTSVMIMKIWDDSDNLDGSRPESLDVMLMKGTETVTTVTLNSENNWMANVTGLPAFEGETPISYTWAEETVSGYRLSETRTLGNMTILTNTHKAEFVSVTVRKVWDDQHDADKLRPTKLKVTLSTGDTYILSDDNNWTVTVGDLPKYDEEGNEIVYTWSEQTVLGYTKAVKVEGNITTFTNTHKVPPTPPTPPRNVPETPLNIGIIINHTGDCYE